MELVVSVDPNSKTLGQLRCGETVFTCALGASGVSHEKREGDGKTPHGRFTLRQVLYRADRLKTPHTGLQTHPINEADGWCDAPDDPSYNCMVTHPYPASAERLWREDNRYDIIVVLGHNDDPVIPGGGSAIFMHVAAEDFRPTEGCIALRQEDLLAVLTHCTSDSTIQI